jgi:hypothetical protein
MFKEKVKLIIHQKKKKKKSETNLYTIMPRNNLTDLYIPPFHVRTDYYEVPLDKLFLMCRCSLNLHKFGKSKKVRITNLLKSHIL